MEPKNHNQECIMVNTIKQKRPGVFVPMDETTHRTLKIQAIEQGTTLQELVSEILGRAGIARPRGRPRGRRPATEQAQ